jgi:serine/threonine-protein phosphatase 2A regulatory subunit B
MTAIPAINWVYANGLGERDPASITDHDVLTSIEFDKTGEFLSVGDKGGRVIVFKRIRSKKKSRVDDFEYFTEFQSHEPGFDYLKSAEIEEKINAMEWINNKSSSLQMLSANDKTIKLWRLFYNKKRKYQSCQKISKGSGIVFPKSEIVEEDWDAMCRKEFSNAHNYHINSVSLSADGEHFLSADDLRVNIWNIENTKVTFSIVDIKPPNIDDLNEVITHAEFHPSRSDMFLFSSSKGLAHLCDARENTQFEK